MERFPALDRSGAPEVLSDMRAGEAAADHPGLA
jgi:hypothetical protein